MPYPSKAKPVDQCSLCVVDTETSGLQAGHHEIIELAWIITDPTGKVIKKREEMKIQLEYPERMSPEAAAVNGYSTQKWVNALMPISAYRHFCADAQDTIMVGFNVEFDWAFIEAALKRYNLRWPGRYFRVDTMALMWPLLWSGRISNRKLATVVEYLGLQQEAAHTAASDAEDCRRAYIYVMGLWNEILDTSVFGEPVRMQR